MLGNRTCTDNSACCIIMMSGGCHEEKSFIVMRHYAITCRVFSRISLLAVRFWNSKRILRLVHMSDVSVTVKSEHINAKQWTHCDRTNRQFGRF